MKDPEPPWTQFQDTEDPEYEDFRAEAALQREKQQECFSKAADAYSQGRKQVASFYSQQVGGWDLVNEPGLNGGCWTAVIAGVLAYCASVRHNL